MDRSGEGGGDGDSTLVEVARYTGHGLTLAMAMGLFLLAGWWLDGRLGTTPLFTIGGALLGAAGGFYHILQHLLFFPREREKEREMREREQRERSRRGGGAGARGRYLLATVFLVGGTVGVGWPFVGPEARIGLLVAAGVAILVQVPTFGVLAAARPGEPGYLLAWGGGTLVRFGVVGGGAFAIARMDGVDLTVALLALAGLLFALLLLEPWALRERGNGSTNG